MSKHCKRSRTENALKRWAACYRETKDDQGNITHTDDKCYDIYKFDTIRHGSVFAEKLYKDGKLNIGIAQAYGDVDGGVQMRTCRWSSGKKEMPCYLYDTEAHQGKIDEEDKTGQYSARTPLAKAFVSFTDPDTKTRYAVWPKQWPRFSLQARWPTDVVATNKTIYRAVKPDDEVRCSPGRDPTPETRNDCAEGTYKPFGDKIANEDFSGNNKIVEGWYNNSVPYRSGGTAADRHSLQIQNCGSLLWASAPSLICWWVDV